MKKRLLSVILALALCLGMSTLSAVQVHAEDEENVDDEFGEQVEGLDGSELTDELVSEVIVYKYGDGSIMPFGSYLSSGTASISNSGNGKVSAYGATFAYSKVSTIKVSVMVQRYNGSSWVSYSSWSASASTASFVSSLKTISVTKGYHYRTKCVHSAGGESMTTYTNGIYIS